MPALELNNELFSSRSLSMCRCTSMLILRLLMVWLLFPYLIMYIQLNLWTSRYCHSMTFIQFHTYRDFYKYSFFPLVIVQWNALPESVVSLSGLEALEDRFSHDKTEMMTFFQLVNQKLRQLGTQQVQRRKHESVSTSTDGSMKGTSGPGHSIHHPSISLSQMLLKPRNPKLSLSLTMGLRWR